MRKELRNIVKGENGAWCIGRIIYDSLSSARTQKWGCHPAAVCQRSKLKKMHRLCRWDDIKCYTRFSLQPKL